MSSVIDEALRAEARRSLAGGCPPDRGDPCDYAKEGQRRARFVGDDEALALWSRLRVRALRAAGSKELVP